MKREAFIWRKSIYDRDFVCSCGKRLADENGFPNGDTLYNQANGDVICPNCKIVAAHTQIIDAPEDMPSGKHGAWSDFERAQKN